MTSDVSIRSYLDIHRSAVLHDEIDAIFFASSRTRTFADEAARSAFRERWLGRYLTNDPKFAFLALTASGNVAGYLVGAIEDPAESARFADVGYFAVFRELTKRFPAHLHVNLAPQFRGLGLGGQLIDAFVGAVMQAGVGGVHVVTSANARNVRFYNRNGFLEVGRTEDKEPLVFLGRSL
jgi:ribosomal protein S18 acetylase RimI-like enzyme